MTEQFGERAEGFWWVRVKWVDEAIPEAGIAWVDSEGAALNFFVGGVLLSSAGDGAAVAEWGPHIGKAPGDILRRVAGWIREHGDDEAYSSLRGGDNNYWVECPSLDALADAIEAMTVVPGEVVLCEQAS